MAQEVVSIWRLQLPNLGLYSTSATPSTTIAYAMPQPDLKVAGCHPHFHIVVADGIFNSEEGLQFHEATLTQDDIMDTQESIQKRVLKYFCKRKFFDKDEMEKMLSYENSGFSLNANVKIEDWDKTGLERLIRYCARPPFNSENIKVHNSLIHYRLPKPSHDWRLFMTLDPLDFVERISHFIPYPRRHRRHYHGVLAPNSQFRKQVAPSLTRCSSPSYRYRSWGC